MPSPSPSQKDRIGLVERLWPAWLGVSRSLLAELLDELLPAGAAIESPRALSFDRRFARPLRALGYAVEQPGPAGGDGLLARADVLCAAAPLADPLADLHRYRRLVRPGGVIVVRCASAGRERVAAAFLHAELTDIRQIRLGRAFLTAGIV
jgi:hypothetical protein